MQINPIQLETPPDTDREDYYQSANAFFHFMKNDNFLYDALSKKALTPRYCREDVRFLHLNLGDTAFEEIAVLQKCFCDIPLHNITSKFPIKYESKNAWPYEHTELYGEFAIAFSKQWGELKQLQPIQYINDNSFYLNTVRQEFDYFLRRKNLSEKLSNSLLYRLAFIKPLRGEMQRVIDTTIIKKSKNFHDEQEWRFIPSPSAIKSFDKKRDKIDIVIANPQMLDLQYGDKSFLENRSDEFGGEPYKNLWLAFDYNDIKYLIVPTNQSRLDCISFILNLPNSHFDLEPDVAVQKSVLISKILVLNEIRKDW